jgi:hypothetical protein
MRNDKIQCRSYQATSTSGIMSAPKSSDPRPLQFAVSGHSARFDFNDELIPIWGALLARLAEWALPLT